VALSDINVFGSPFLLENLRKARINDRASNLVFNSRRIPLVDTHVIKQIYVSIWVEDDYTCTGSTKSITVCENGGSSETRYIG